MLLVKIGITLFKENYYISSQVALLYRLQKERENKSSCRHGNIDTSYRNNVWGDVAAQLSNNFIEIIISDQLALQFCVPLLLSILVSTVHT